MLTRTAGIDFARQSEVRIGPWRADPGANELSRPGESVRIEPKAMAVLMLLAEHPAEVVGRDELLATVWPGVVVGDEALTQAIIKLRKALGDNPRAPTYIETISKRGYRLIAPVADSLAAPATEPHPPAAVRRPRIVWALAACGLLLATLLAFSWWPSTQLPVPSRPAAERETATATVAVLPFESLNTDGDQAYLARGISNDLMTDLARLPGLQLIRATGPEVGPQTARYLVAGAVRRDADTLRVNIHLIDTQTRQQLWSERYDRPIGDLFAVQDDITRRLTALLPGKLEQASLQRRAQRYTRSLAAYDYFLRGQTSFLVRRAGDNEAARGFYRKAIELDPGFARAYAGLAMTHAIEFRLRPQADAGVSLTRAFELAETARQIDPEIPEVHWALGFVHAQTRRHEQAIAALQRAIALNRSYADAYALMGGIYTYVGEPAKSVPLLRTALRLDPEGGYLYYMVLGRAYFFVDDHEQALLNLREAATRNPVDLETRVFLAAAQAAAGDANAAEWEAEEVRALDPSFSVQRWLQTYPLTDARQRQRLVELLARAGL